MKVTIHQLASLRHASFELRPFTAIIGRNNTNKTFLSYLVYGAINTLHSAFVDLPKSSFPPMHSKREDAVCITRVSLERIRDLLQLVVSGVLGSFSSRLSSFFQDSGEIFSQASIQIEISVQDVAQAALRLARDYEHEEELSFLRTKGRAKKRLSVEITADSFVIRSSRDVVGIDWEEFAGHFLAYLFPRAIVLPAERNALLITYRILAARRYHLLRSFQRGQPRGRRIDERRLELMREEGDVRYSQPIEDFLDLLTQLELERVSNEPPSDFMRLASLIETSLQGDHRLSYKPTRLGGRELRLELGEKGTLDVYNASSSVKQLAPLLLLLQNGRIREGTMVFIDEPEMNLHPESQVRLLEGLAILTKLGANVFMTTHSPYVMAHLNTIALDPLTEGHDRESMASHLFIKDARALLEASNVAAFAIEKGDLVNIREKNEIVWTQLSDVAEEVQRRYFAMRVAKN